MKREMERERLPPLSVNRQERKPQNPRPAMVVQTRALQYRQPLIIHTFSPEIVQTNSHDFMQLVQKLTGQANHVPPVTKRPRRASEELHLSPTLHNLGGSSLALRQQQQGITADLGLHRGLLPQSSFNSGLPTSLSPHNKEGARMQGGSSVVSPASFEFSPTMLPSPTFLCDFPSLLSPQAAALLSPRLAKAGVAAGSPMMRLPAVSFEFSPSMLRSPTTFLRDFPSLLSPKATALVSPRLAKAGGVARSPVMMLPAALPSPGPLNSAFLADLPVLSPAAYKWVEKHPLSAEFMLSPLPRGLGLPPRSPSPANMDDHYAAWDFD
eukprot:c21318_g1_i1 orf=350-1321(+)